MANPLLVLYVHVEISNHDDAAIGANALLPATELARLHIALHDVHPVLLVEGNTGDFIEADHVVLAYQPALPAGIVDKHSGDGCFPSRN